MDYPGRFYTPAINASIDMQPVLDRLTMFDPENKDYIDAFIRHLRREWRKPKKKWWQKWFSK